MFNNKKTITFSVLILLLLSTVFFAANSGSIKASVGQLAVGIFTGEYANVNAIIDVRFPRIIITILVGAALGVSGLLISKFALWKLFRYLINCAGVTRQNLVSRNHDF